MPQVYTAEFECNIINARLMDVDIRLHPVVTELHDMVFDVITPYYDVFDMLTVPVRTNEAVEQPFESAKEDTASFFSTYEAKEEDYIHSSYSSPDLKAMALVSENLSRPLGKFQSTQAMGIGDITFSVSDEYVALSFLDVSNFESLEVLRRGMSCIVTGNKGAYAARDSDDLVKCYDYNNIVLNGVLSGTTLPSNIIDNFASFYYAIVYFPLTKDYYFRLTSADGSNLQIDDQLIIEDYTTDTLTAIEGIAYVEKGFHLVFIRQQDFTGIDIVELEFKTSEEAEYLPFTVDNCLVYNMDMYAAPFLNETIQEEGEDFFFLPAKIEDMSLNSLYLKYYRPITIIARLQSDLLLKEIESLRYLRTPDVLLSSTVIRGDIENIASSYNLGVLSNGVTIDTSGNEPTFITYQYADAVGVSWFEITEVSLYDETSLDNNQCSSFCLSLSDKYSVLFVASYLHSIIDTDSCINISSVAIDTNYKIRLYKKENAAYTRVVFTCLCDITQLEISTPSVLEQEWGLISTIRVYGEVSDLVKLIDARGVRTAITTDSANLTTVNYGEIGFIPAVFQPRYLPRDLQYGGEFLMFCIKVLGEVPPIQILGNTYVYKNESDHLVDVDAIFQVNMLTMQNKRMYNFYHDIDKNSMLDWTYLGYNTDTQLIEQTDFSVVTIDIINTTGGVLTDYIIKSKVPNIGSGYTAVDQDTNVVPISGVKASGSLTDDIVQWNTQYVHMVVDVPIAGATITLTTSASLSDPVLIVGTDDPTAYSALSNMLLLHMSIARLPTLGAGQVKNIYALYEETGCVINNALTYNVPTFITLDRVTLTELSGSEQTNIIVRIDVSKLAQLYEHCPMVVFDGDTRLPYDTVGVNKDGTNADDFTKWDGAQISVRIPSIEGGVSKILLLRVGAFNGDASTFISSIETDTLHVLHFSDSLLNSVQGTSPMYANNMELWTDKRGDYHKAAIFDSSRKSYIQYEPLLPDYNFTFSVWIQVEATTEGIFSCIYANLKNDNSYNNKLSVLASGELQYAYLEETSLGSGSFNIQTSDTTGVNLFDGNWHHIVVTFEGTTTIKIYDNTVLVGDFTIINTLQYDPHNFTLGTSTTNSLNLLDIDTFEGVMDEVRTYDKVLTPEQITTLYEYYDGVQTDIIVRDLDSTAVITPTNQITTMLDITSLEGTPVVIYKYLGIDESVVRWIT